MVKAVIHQASQANLLVANYLSEHLLLDEGTIVALFPPQLLQEIAARTMIETVNLDREYCQSFDAFGGRVLRSILNLLYQYSGASARFSLQRDGNLHLTGVAGTREAILPGGVTSENDKSDFDDFDQDFDLEDSGVDH